MYSANLILAFVAGLSILTPSAFSYPLLSDIVDLETVRRLEENALPVEDASSWPIFTIGDKSLDRDSNDPEVPAEREKPASIESEKKLKFLEEDAASVVVPEESSDGSTVIKRSVETHGSSESDETSENSVEHQELPLDNLKFEPGYVETKETVEENSVESTESPEQLSESDETQEDTEESDEAREHANGHSKLKRSIETLESLESVETQENSTDSAESLEHLPGHRKSKRSTRMDDYPEYNESHEDFSESDVLYEESSEPHDSHNHSWESHDHSWDSHDHSWDSHDHSWEDSHDHSDSSSCEKHSDEMVRQPEKEGGKDIQPTTTTTTTISPKISAEVEGPLRFLINPRNSFGSSSPQESSARVLRSTLDREMPRLACRLGHVRDRRGICRRVY